MANYQSAYTGSQHDTYTTKSSLIDLIYPIGSIYISMNETDPAILFGGTWERISGRFLLGCGEDGPGANNDTGFGQLTIDQQTWFSQTAPGITSGEFVNTLTENQLPIIDTGTISWHGQEHGTHVYRLNGKWYGTQITGQYQTTGATSGAFSHGDIGIRFGGGNSHNNMPPFITVAIWQRVT